MRYCKLVPKINLSEKHEVIKIKIFILLSLPVILFQSGCVSNIQEADFDIPPRGQQIQKIDDLAYYQLFCDGFSLLDLQSKMYAYHLYRACVISRDIVYDQLAPEGLAIRELVNLLASNDKILDPVFRQSFETYAHKFWTNNGNYDLWSYNKFIPLFRDDIFIYQIKLLSGDTVEVLSSDQIALLMPFIFDPEFRPVLTIRSEQNQKDNLSGIALNLYDPQIKLEDARRLGDSVPPNSRLALVDGEVIEEVYRADASDVPPGRAHSAVEAVIYELEKASGYAPAETANALIELIKYLQRGEFSHFERHLDLSLKDESQLIEFIFGFLDFRFDPLAQRGLFEGMILFRDYTTNRIIKTFEDNIDWFTEHLPVDNKHRNYKPIENSLLAYKVICSTGNSAVFSPIEKMLTDIGNSSNSLKHKKFIFANVMESFSTERAKTLYNEFINSVLEREEALFAFNQRVLVIKIIQELLSDRASGFSSENSSDSSREFDKLKPLMLEIQKTLISLWFIGNHKLVDLGILPGGLNWQGAYRAFLAESSIDLAMLNTEKDQLTDQSQSRIIIANHLIRADACRLDEVGARYFLKLTNLKTTQNTVGELLHEITEIIGNKDQNRAGQIVKTYLYGFDPFVSRQITERFEKLGISNKYAFIFPDLVPKRNRMGGVTDIEIRYPGDLQKQMLRFEEIRRGK